MVIITMNNIFCYNCGHIGHSYKSCHYPIISNGIICFRKKHGINIADFKKKIKFLAIRRKYTLGYTNFIRGQYELNTESLLNLINVMTVYEKEKIQSETFDSLWKNLWMIDNINNYQNEYRRSKDKFSLLNSEDSDDIKLSDVIKLSNTNYTEQEWGFPKGKRERDESNIQSAIREFEEETNLKGSQYNILNLKPIIEDFMGTDNRKYRNIYYIAEYLEENESLSLDNDFQKVEISAIKLMGFNKIKKLIRPYNPEKIQVLESLINSLKFIYST
jgi:8-oxo-dGTP pyrophosphatase MutT (NUDIX family)